MPTTLAYSEVFYPLRNNGTYTSICLEYGKVCILLIELVI